MDWHSGCSFDSSRAAPDVVAEPMKTLVEPLRTQAARSYSAPDIGGLPYEERWQIRPARTNGAVRIDGAWAVVAADADRETANWLAADLAAAGAEVFAFSACTGRSMMHERVQRLPDRLSGIVMLAALDRQRTVLPEPLGLPVSLHQTLALVQALGDAENQCNRCGC